MRIPSDVLGQQNIIPVYDALGGYLIANAILTKFGRSGIEPWLKESGTLEALNGDVVNCHPLAQDIFAALVGLIPRRLNRQQLWQSIAEPLQTVALTMAAELEGKFLDAGTITALATFIREAKPGSRNLFLRLFRTRGIPEHPLNADFLDQILHSMSVAARDLHWTEWVRDNANGICNTVLQLEKKWQKNLQIRTQGDQLRAKWIMWLLTTTVRNLRDRVTRSIYWFGRGDPEALFRLAETVANVNDPYVFERILAASYGVAMSTHCHPSKNDFRKKTLPEYARKFFDLLFKEGAQFRTTHVLIREYGWRFIELAILHNSRSPSPSNL